MVTTTRAKTSRTKARQSRSQEATTAQRESEARLEALMENTRDLLWEVDQVCVYTYVSPNVAAVLGYEPEEVLGKTVLDFMPPADAKEFGKALAEVLSEQQPFAGLERTIRCQDGSLLTLECNGKPVFDDQGQLLGFRGVDRDITDRKRLESRSQELAHGQDQKYEELEARSRQLVGYLMPWGV